MRKIEANATKLSLDENVEMIYERKVTRFGNSAKLDAPRKFIGWRAYVIIVKD